MNTNYRNEDSAATTDAPYPGEEVAPPETQPIEGPPETLNLAEALAQVQVKRGADGVYVDGDKDDTEARRLACAVVDDFEADARSRSGRMRKIKEITEHYSNLLPPKSFPFQKAANVNLPMLAYLTLQTHARLFDMIMPETGKVVHCPAMTPFDRERAYAAETIANWRLRSKIPEYWVGMDATLLNVVLYGSAFRRVVWDRRQSRERADFISIDDFVVAATEKSQDPLMRDVPRYTWVDYLTRYDLEDEQAAGNFVNVDKIKSGDGNMAPTDMQALRERSDGTTPPSDLYTDDSKLRRVIEQHRVWRMPKAPNVDPMFDGQWHHLAVTVDVETKTLLRCVVIEEDDPSDFSRYTRESTAYTEKQMLLEAEVQQQNAAIDVAISSNPAAAESLEGMRPGPVDAGPPPKAQRRRRIAHFIHFGALPSPDGFYYHGLGDFILPINRAANAILNQRLDSMTLSLAKPAFISRQLKIARGSVSVRPGEFIEVDGPASAMKEGIMWLEPPPTDASAERLVTMLQELGDKFLASSDLMSGSTSGSNRTAKEMTILQAESQKAMTVISRRVKESFRAELDLLWKIWGTFLPAEPEPEAVTNEVGTPEIVPMTRELFLPSARILPASDARLQGEKRQDALNLYGFVMQSPLAMNPAAVHASMSSVLRSHDALDVLATLGPPPPPGMMMPPPGMPPGPPGAPPGGPPPEGGPPQGPPPGAPQT